MVKISRKKSTKLAGKKSNGRVAQVERVTGVSNVISGKDRYKITESIPALTARTQLGSIMERATKNKDRFLVSKRGEAKVIILGLEDYLKNIVKQPKVLTRLQKQAQKAGSDKLTIEEINAEIVAAREG